MKDTLGFRVQGLQPRISEQGGRPPVSSAKHSLLIVSREGKKWKPHENSLEGITWGSGSRVQGLNSLKGSSMGDYIGEHCWHYSGGN